MKNILECDASEAKIFFMDEKSYFSYDLPNYFSFKGILEECEKLIKNNYKDNIDTNILRNVGSTNYTIFIEKDINYQWRPIEIINPYLYVNLVNTLFENWEELVNRFKILNCDKIKCCSMPIISNNAKKDSILNWWNEFEQNIISMNLSYRYMGVTDITNCYSSIYTHSIAWAISGKDECKKDRKNTSILGNKIDQLIMEIQGTQTNGIPQGSKLMDFIAEIVLAYADAELSKKINEKSINGYYILRYRDDYRVFSNDKNDVEIILKLLTETLCELNLKLNQNKTFITDDILGNALKKDKLEMITRGINIEQSIQKRLYSIWSFSRKYPNSGSLIKLLVDFFETITKENSMQYIQQIVSLIIDIMYNSPRIYPQAIAIISKLFEFGVENQAEYIEYIINKFSNKPSTDYLEIWLQRITLLIDTNKQYHCNLCKCVNNVLYKLWDFSWLKQDIKSTIINFDVINNMELVIDRSEIDFEDKY